MCGFFGVFDINGNLASHDKVEIEKGLESISYRGPDDKNFYFDKYFCVGFNRLSIIDLKAKPQPHISENNQYILVCNGEIYNYLELKKELENKYKFYSHVDTEVLLPGYLEWGDNFWKKINGMFSIVIYDKLEKKIILIRDHVGIKPIHYMISNNKYYFASDYNCFFHQSNKKLNFNENSILSYFSFRYVIGNHSFLKDVFDVMPGEYIEIKSSVKNSVYWNLSLDKKEDKGENYYLEQLESEFEETIKRQLMSDVKVGAFISGGLDSSLILYYMSKLKNNIETFTTGFEESSYDETSYAEKISELYGLKMNKTIVNQNVFIDNMLKAMEARGEPNAIPHEIPFFLMSKKMKGKIKVVLSGEGADELFGGYGRLFLSPMEFYKKKYLKLSNQTELDHFLNRYAWFSKDDKIKFLNTEIFKNNFFDENSYDYLNKIFSECRELNYFDKMYYIMIKIHLVNMLNRLDRMTMFSSIEARVPFLDKKLIELIFSIPNKYKIKWKSNMSKVMSIFSSSDKVSEKLDIPKYILKKISKNKVPDEIINRKKFPFPLPVNIWLKSKLGEMCKDVLLSKNLKLDNYINKSNIQKFLDDKKFINKEDLDGKKIWMLVNLENWLRSNNL